MQQLVNLYQIQFRERKSLLSTRDSLILLGGTLTLMLLLSIDSYFVARSKNIILAQSIYEYQSLEKEVALIKSRMDSQLVNPRLVKDLQQMEMHYAKKQEILRLIEKPLNGKQSAFSTLLEGLARQHITGMWLTNIDVHTGGEQMSLHGSTLQPVLIPEFVGKLNREVAYVGREFKTMTMVRSLENSSRIDFTLTTEKIEKDKRDISRK